MIRWRFASTGRTVEPDQLHPKPLAVRVATRLRSETSPRSIVFGLCVDRHRHNPGRGHVSLAVKAARICDRMPGSHDPGILLSSGPARLAHHPEFDLGGHDPDSVGKIGHVTMCRLTDLSQKLG